MSFGRHLINFLPLLSPVSFSPSLCLLVLSPVQGGGLYPLSRLIPIIPPVPHFPSPKFSCFCFVYLYALPVLLSSWFYPQSSTLFMIRSVLIMGIMFLLFRTFNDFRKNTFFVPCMFPVGPSVINSWVLEAMLVCVFRSSLYYTYYLNTTLQCFLNPR